MTSSIPSSTVNTPTLTPLVDAALTEVTGSVIGGGNPEATGPVTRIPAFVQQYLDGDASTAPSATGGYVEQARDNEAPSKKRGDDTGALQSRQGQATRSFPPFKGHQGPPTAPPNVNDTLPPGSKGEATDCAPRRYRRLPAPPMKTPPPVQGEPPMKTPPPMKGEPPMKTPPPAKGEPPMKAPPTKDADGPVPVQDAPTPTRTYGVVVGDNLSQIAEKFDISWRQLYWANKDQIQNPDLIYAGQTLTVPTKDLQVPDFAYSPTFTPGIRSETAGTGTVTISTPPAKEPAAPPKGSEPPAKTPDAPVKVDPAPPKDATTTPTPDSPGAPPSPSPGSGQAPPAPGTSGNGLPPTLP